MTNFILHDDNGMHTYNVLLFSVCDGFVLRLQLSERRSELQHHVKE